MKKQALKEIETLVKEFNEKNSYLDRPYTFESLQFKRGHYSAKIEYTVFFSLDLTKLVEFVTKNNLLMMLGTYTQSKKAYISIQ